MATSGQNSHLKSREFIFISIINENYKVINCEVKTHGKLTSFSASIVGNKSFHFSS